MGRTMDIWSAMDAASLMRTSTCWAKPTGNDRIKSRAQQCPALVLFNRSDVAIRGAEAGLCQRRRERVAQHRRSLDAPSLSWSQQSPSRVVIRIKHFTVAVLGVSAPNQEVDRETQKRRPNAARLALWGGTAILGLWQKRRLLRGRHHAHTLTGFIGLLMAVLIAAPPAYRVVGYFRPWSIYDRGYHATDIPADKTNTSHHAAGISPTAKSP